MPDNFKGYSRDSAAQSPFKPHRMVITAQSNSAMPAPVLPPKEVPSKYARIPALS
jgi:hypothetical protein